MYCQHCNKEIERENASFCPTCGGQLVDKAELQASKENKTDIKQDTSLLSSKYIPDEVIEAYVVKHKDRYKNLFRKFQDGKKISFNWAAFFAGPLWMIYRRMYLYLIIIIVICFIVGSTIPLYAPCIIGDWLYYNRFKKNYEKNNGNVTLKAGVNILAYWLIIVYFLLLLIFIALIFS